MLGKSLFDENEVFLDSEAVFGRETSFWMKAALYIYGQNVFTNSNSNKK